MRSRPAHGVCAGASVWEVLHPITFSLCMSETQSDAVELQSATTCHETCEDVWTTDTHHQPSLLHRGETFDL